MLVICPIFDRCELLPFYLQYYERLGATQFVVALWNGERNPLYEVIKTYQQWPIDIRTSIDCLVKEYNGPSETAGINRIRLEYKDKFPWYCLADLDEFCWFEDGRNLPEVVAEAEKRGFTAVHGCFFDRFARNGKFPPVRSLHSLDSTFPLVADLTRLLGANPTKIPLSRSDVVVESGHHYTKGKAWGNQAEVHHFKWTEGIVARMHERDLYHTTQGLPWSGESVNFIRAITAEDFAEENYNWREARKLGI